MVASIPVAATLSLYLGLAAASVARATTDTVAECEECWCPSCRDWTHHVYSASIAGDVERYVCCDCGGHNE